MSSAASAWPPALRPSPKPARLSRLIGREIRFFGVGVNQFAFQIGFSNQFQPQSDWPRHHAVMMGHVVGGKGGGLEGVGGVDALPKQRGHRTEWHDFTMELKCRTKLTCINERCKHCVHRERQRERERDCNSSHFVNMPVVYSLIQLYFSLYPVHFSMLPFLILQTLQRRWGSWQWGRKFGHSFRW